MDVKTLKKVPGISDPGTFYIYLFAFLSFSIPIFILFIDSSFPMISAISKAPPGVDFYLRVLSL